MFTFIIKNMKLSYLLKFFLSILIIVSSTSIVLAEPENKELKSNQTEVLLPASLNSVVKL